MARTGLAGAVAAVAAAVAALVAPQTAVAFVPSSTVLSSPFRQGTSISSSSPSARSRGATRPRATASAAVMKVAATQPSQDWQEGLRTRDIFNALSQGEIGKRAFTQALAKRMVSKATGVQQAYELQSEAASLAASSSAIVSEEGELRYRRRGFVTVL